MLSSFAAISDGVPKMLRIPGTPGLWCKASDAAESTCIGPKHKLPTFGD